MSKFKFLVLLVILSAFSAAATAGDKVVKRVPAGAVAFHFVADLTFGPTGAPLVGYIAYIEGVDGPLFADPVITDPANPPPPYSKDTAYFTISITTPTPFPTFLPVETDPGLIVQLLEPAGAKFTVFYNANPVSRDWGDPLTFQQGVPIAVFEESALLGTGISATSFNTFSSWLVSSNPINFKGQKINFKRLVPNGVTTTNFTKTRFDENWNVVGASFGGTSVAIGGKSRNGSCDDDSDD